MSDLELSSVTMLRREYEDAERDRRTFSCSSNSRSCSSCTAGLDIFGSIFDSKNVRGYRFFSACINIVLTPYSITNLQRTLQLWPEFNVQSCDLQSSEEGEQPGACRALINSSSQFGKYLGIEFSVRIRRDPWK